MSVWDQTKSLRDQLDEAERDQEWATRHRDGLLNSPHASAWTAKALAAGDGEAQKRADANSNPPSLKDQRHG